MQQASFLGRNFGVIGLLLCTLFSVTHTAHAALLYLDPTDATVFRGDSVTLSLRVNTDEGECINTVDAVITYDEGIRAVDVSRGRSILNIWVEDPVINETNRTITFAGGIPGGYCGRAAGDPSLTNVVADIVFNSPGFAIGGGSANPTPSVSIAPQSRVLLHDGLGTDAPLRTEDAALTLLDTPGQQINDSWRERVGDDIIAPGDFSITLSQSDTAFSNKYFIVFNTQDKQSGVDHYEVMEEPLADFYSFTWGRADAPWVRTESPYVLKDQTLNSTIRVKAIDKAGNETISVLVPDGAMRGLSLNRLITYVLAGSMFIIVLVGIGYVLLKRKKRLEQTYE